ncbi:MAG TPA: dihydroneopterin aldolase [Bacteroidetes bacterium]|nr:dihydroneopterin aldolase [Bacteroidota bacterium]
MDVIRLLNMAFFGFHGVHEEEHRLGQRFEVDLELFLDLSAAGNTDDPARTVDYSLVYELVEEIVIEREYRLLEGLAEEIAGKILERFPVEMVTVRVRKPNAPVRGILDAVEVEITRS